MRHQRLFLIALPFSVSRAAAQSGRADPALLLIKCLKGCELLEPLTNGQLMVMADLMQPVGGRSFNHSLLG